MGTLTSSPEDIQQRPYGGVRLAGAAGENITSPQKITLRPYQVRDLQAIREQLKTHRSVLLVQPTGAGKGTLASFIVHSAVKRGNAVIFLVNRRTLVHDFAQRLGRLGIDHGVIMADDKRRKPWLSVHVASIDTLNRRAVVPQAQLLIVDEAHFAASPTWCKVLEKYPDAKILGMSATPVRLDGRSLDMFQSMVTGPTVADLISEGYLVPSRTFAPSSPDLSGVRTTAGDFNQKALAEVCDRKKLVGDIVQHWQRLASDRLTIAFGVDQAHAAHIAEEFRCAGITAKDVNADTPDEVRDVMWEDLRTGRLRVVTSVGVLSYGFDAPHVSAVILARPTEAIALHLQQLGRGARPFPGKQDLLVLDHAGNTHRHGFYEDPRTWSLSGRGLATGDGDARACSISTCLVCYQTFRPNGARKCPYCGAEIPKHETEIEVVKDDLQEVTPRMVCSRCRREMTGAKAGDWCDPEALRGRVGCDGTARRAYEVKELSKNPRIAEIQRTAAEKGYSSGWIWHQIKALNRRRA